MAGWQPNPAASPDQRLVAIETMMCEALNRLFGNGQKGELDKLDDRITVIEKQSEKTSGAAELKGSEQARFYTRAGLAFAGAEILIHGLGWAKDLAIAAIASGGHH